MAETQAEAGLTFYAAVSQHNAAVAFLNAGDLRAALRLADGAISAFEDLPFAAPERLSTYALVATAHLELGNRSLADLAVTRAMETGEEFSDVAAELAFASIAVGDRREGSLLLGRAESLVRENRTDAIATAVYETARAFGDLPASPPSALRRLLELRADDVPNDFGHLLTQQSLLAMSYLLNGNNEDAAEIAEAGLDEARQRLARRAEARLGITLALARKDAEAATLAVMNGASTGHLAIAELADALGDHLHLFAPMPKEIEQSIAMWPERWLPVLRRKLDDGNTSNARVAARLLDRFGQLQDVGKLRAFAKTYRRNVQLAPLGVELAQRVSPALAVNDLGRVGISIGDRAVDLAAMRRKPASLLMYLVTRPSFTANREQVFDELWTDTDPASASNSLNQSLYFLRRELDPWYEDSLSVDYVALQGELLWLNPRLVSAESATFQAATQEALKARSSTSSLVDLIYTYRGPFAPEFEYEEWAMAWRSRIHATFLELVTRGIDRAVSEGDLAAARDAAVHCLDVDPANEDVERRLVWLYWHLGARSAAGTQYEHLANRERADGFHPIELQEIVSRPRPED